MEKKNTKDGVWCSQTVLEFQKRTYPVTVRSICTAAHIWMSISKPFFIHLFTFEYTVIGSITIWIDDIPKVKLYLISLTRCHHWFFLCLSTANRIQKKINYTYLQWIVHLNQVLIQIGNFPNFSFNIHTKCSYYHYQLSTST